MYKCSNFDCIVLQKLYVKLYIIFKNYVVVEYVFFFNIIQ